jgi:hypothetical protein
MTSFLKKHGFLLALALPLLFPWLASAAHATQLTACAAGSTTCGSDTTNDNALALAIGDPVFQSRVRWLWEQACLGVLGETGTTTGHIDRVAYCQRVLGNSIPDLDLVRMILAPTVVGEILAATSPANPAGNAVDADINAAIATALTVTQATAQTTATQATAGVNYFSVPSLTGIIPGQYVFGPNIPSGARVLATAVVGSTNYVAISADIAAALSSSPVVFSEFSGLSTLNGQ